MNHKGKLIVGMSGGDEHSRTHSGDKKKKKTLDHKPHCQEKPKRIEVI